MFLKHTVFIFIFLGISCFSYAQRIPEKVIDTFTIRTGKIILYENNKWEYIDENLNDTAKSAGNKNYFDSEMLINQDKSPYKKTNANNKKTNKKDKNKTTDGASIHYVKRGDTLMGIALQYGVPLKTLFRVNKLSKKSKLHIGQKIKLR